MNKLIHWIGKTFGSKSNKCPEEEHCLELARLMLDEESTADDKQYVMKHIGSCYKCYDNYDVEKAIREVVKQKCKNLKIPQDVTNQIREKIGAH